MTRQDSWFFSGGEWCAAWLYPAAGGTAPSPVVVMAPGLTGTRRGRRGCSAAGPGFGAAS